MKSIYSNIYVYQGADFTKSFQILEDTTDPFSLEGFVLKGQIRKTWSSSVAYDIDLFVDDPQSGVIEILVSSEETLKMKPGRYLYDVYGESTESDGRTFKFIEGILTLEPRITRLEEGAED